MYQILRKRDLQSTDRLNQEKCQVIVTTYCSGGKTLFFFLLSRSGNAWLVKSGRYNANLKSSVGDDPSIPPTTGWKFYNLSTGKMDEDQQLTCNISPASSSCSVKVSLKGVAKDIQRECEGEYRDAGMRSSGRKVTNFSMCSSPHSDLLSGFQTGGLCC